MLTEAAVVLAALTAQDPGVDLTTFLDERLGLSDNEVSEVRAGEVVTRKLEAASDREVALVGVVRVDVSRARFLESFMDIESFLLGESVRLAGKFSRPPVVADLAALGLSDEDIQALRDCRIGDCDVKLSAERIAEIGALDWSAPENRARLERMGRAWLLEYVEDYLDRGDSALVIYDDRDDPQPLHEGFHALLAESPYVFRYAPELHHYLDEFPTVALDGAHDFPLLERLGRRAEADHDLDPRDRLSLAGGRHALDGDRVEADLCEPLLPRFPGAPDAGGRRGWRRRVPRLSGSIPLRHEDRVAAPRSRGGPTGGPSANHAPGDPGTLLGLNPRARVE